MIWTRILLWEGKGWDVFKGYLWSRTQRTLRLTGCGGKGQGWQHLASVTAQIMTVYIIIGHKYGEIQKEQEHLVLKRQTDKNVWNVAEYKGLKFKRGYLSWRHKFGDHRHINER